MDNKFLRALMSELVGTFAFVFLTAAAVCAAYFGPLPPASINLALLSGIASGLIYAAALAVTVPVSGGYLNPAVTIALWVFRRLDGGKTLALLAVQVLGSALAGGALYYLVGIQDNVAIASHLGAPQISETFQVGSFAAQVLKGIGLELVLTAIVVFVLFAVTFDTRVSRAAGGWVGRLSFVWIGLALAAATIVASPLTGGGLNPARWFGPALWDLRQSGSFTYHAVYWVGPIAGAMLAGWVYTSLVLPTEEEERVGQPTTSSRATASSAGLARSKK
jgi:glycerol uptake facilitator-like aquaporin